jgi:general stress protein 26
MKIQTQHRPDLARLAEMIEGIDVTMLATSGPGGEIDTRPMTPVEMDEHGAIWFLTDSHASLFGATGPVNLAFVDTDRSIYVSISGTAARVDDRARIHELWTLMARPWFPDGPDSPDLTLLRVLPVTADIWDAPHSKVVRLLAIAASVAAGRPVGLGEHEHLQPDLPGLTGLRPVGAA